MKRWAVAFLGLWALAGTVAVIVLAARAPDTVVERVVAPAPRRSTLGERSRERLRKRVDELEAALQATLATAVPETVARATADEPQRTPAERLAALLEEQRRLESGGGWTVARARALRARINALLAGDASTHEALMEQLRGAPDEDAAWQLLGLLVDNPFVRTTSRRRVTDAIRASAREMLEDPLPHRRGAAARVLFGYRGVTREDALLGIGRLSVESDDMVREEVLAEVSGGARDVGLTEEEVRPLLEQLRETIGAPGGSWAANALADWSDSAADFEFITQRLAAERDPDAGQDLLNALARDKRLVGPRVAEARGVLLGVLADATRPEVVRDLAHDFLRGYSPWDANTANAVRRYLAEAR